MNGTRTIASGLLVAALAFAPQVARSQQAAQLLEFNYGIPTADHATVFVAQDLNLFEKAGLKPKFFYFQSGAPLLAGLRSGTLDVATAGLALTFALGQDIPLKFLFWEANNAAAEGLIVDPNGPVKSYQDIGKAQKIGAALGTCAEVSLYLMTKKVGVDYAKLNVVNICSATVARFVPEQVDRRRHFVAALFATTAVGRLSDCQFRRGLSRAGRRLPRIDRRTAGVRSGTSRDRGAAHCRRSDGARGDAEEPASRRGCLRQASVGNARGREGDTRSRVLRSRAELCRPARSIVAFLDDVEGSWSGREAVSRK